MATQTTQNLINKDGDIDDALLNEDGDIDDALLYTKPVP
jgi:hypothetical protein